MNNDAFRKLVASTPARQDDGATPARPGALGTKKNSFVPMTPRPGKAAGSDDFARQVREQHAQMRPPKKYKSSAPKGSKFGSGYVDRAKARQAGEEEDQDDRAERIKALEEQAKLGQIPWETFEALRDKITGGDVSSTHLVKGLDRQLLERVRRGEDVLGLGKKDEEETGQEVDVDDELEKLGEQEVATIQKTQTEKRGAKAVGPIAGKKRTRDELLAELKAQRKAAAEAKAANAPKLDGRWKKIGDQSQPKVEFDHKGREVVTVVQEDGTVKKMVRKAAPAAIESKATIDMPDFSRPVLGADVAIPEQKRPEPDEESDDDIFAGAGTDYNPLGDGEEDDDSDSEDDGKAEASKKPVALEKPKEDADRDEGAKDNPSSEHEGPVPTTKSARNYFGEGTSQNEEEAEKNRFKGIENVLKKAANLAADKIGSDEDEDDDAATREEREARKAKRARMLAQQDRDLDDMDLGFGGSRGEDEEDDGMDSKVKLAEWKGGRTAGDDGWEEDDGKGGDKKKKRKPKKRKGDVNNAADIFRVIEGRKAKENK